MKPATKFSLLIISLIVVSGAQLYMCTSEPSRHAVVDFPREQQTLSTELADLQYDINQNLEKTGRQIQVSSSDSKDRLVRVNRAFLRENVKYRKRWRVSTRLLKRLGPALRRTRAIHWTIPKEHVINWKRI